MSQSSWKEKIQKKWGPHIHCSICGKAMSSDKQFCSQGCRDNYLTRERKQKRKGRLQCIFFAVIMVVLMVIMFLPGLF